MVRGLFTNITDKQPHGRLIFPVCTTNKQLASIHSYPLPALHNRRYKAENFPSLHDSIMPTPHSDLIFEIDVQGVQALRDAGEDFLLLDCREPSEYATAQIAGSVLIPMREIPQRLAELEAHKQGRIVVHCHHGGRSARVTEFLRSHGFQGAQNMSGGIDAWSQLIDPTVPRY